MSQQTSLFGNTKISIAEPKPSKKPNNPAPITDQPIVTSVSGGKSSAYLAANYPSDYLVFALVRIEDPDCRYPDEALRKRVEDRIQAPFIGTTEDDTIIHTMFDLEQYLGQKIHWVTGITFDEVVKEKGGWLPNKLHRYCTSNLKIAPIVYWAHGLNILPFVSQVGFRAGEEYRVNKMRKRINENGFLEFKATFGKHKQGRHKGNNKWETIEYAIPAWPLVHDRIYRDLVNGYWKNKDVRFAKLNNCVACFNRDSMLINHAAHIKPSNMNVLRWFSRQEGGKNGYWKNGVTYEEIIEATPQENLSFKDFSGCDSGYCGI